MPPLLTGLDDLFPSLNFVLVGWALLACCPRYKHTPTIVLSICGAYSLLYAVALVSALRAEGVPEGGGFDTLQGVVNLFKSRGMGPSPSTRV